MSILDSLVNVTISISSPVASVASFNTVNIVGNAPEDAETQPDPVGRYTGLTEIIEAGWSSDDPVYKTAATLFGNGATEVIVSIPQEESGSEEDIDKTLARAEEFGGWYGFVISGKDYAEVSAKYAKAKEYADGAHKMFMFVADWSGESPVSPIEDTAYCSGIGTRNLSDETANALNMPAAWMAKGFSYTPGSETWAYKTLSGVKPDKYTSTDINGLKEAGLNYYIECAGRNITLEGKTTSGEWIDVIRFKDWLLNNIQSRIYNVFISNSKIPYTDAGITLIQNQLIAALKEGQNRNGIAMTAYDEYGNTIPGYTVTVPTMASIPESVRATRKLPLIKFTARLSGAIHTATINGTLVQ